MISGSIAIAGGKGGIGKTSIATSLAGLAAIAGVKTLFVDLDPQNNSAEDLGVTHEDEGEGLLASFLLGKEAPAVIRGIRNNLDYIPSGPETRRLRDLLTMDSSPANLYKLTEAITKVAADYQLVIFDTAPASDQLLKAAMMAAHYLIMPTASDQASINGLAETSDTFSEVVSQGLNPHLSVLGTVLFGINSSHTTRKRAAKQRVEEALEGTPVRIFNSSIREAKLASDHIRDLGLLPIEYHRKAEDASTYWQSKAEGTPYIRFATNALGLAEDYASLWREIEQAREEALSLWQVGEEP